MWELKKGNFKNSIVYKMFLDPVGTEDKEKSWNVFLFYLHLNTPTIDKLIIMFYKIKKSFRYFKRNFEKR